MALAGRVPIQEQADPDRVLVESPTLLVTPEQPSTPEGNCTSLPSIDRQEGPGGTGEYHSLCMCLSNSINSIANTIMMATPCSSMAAIPSRGSSAGAGAGLGAGILVPEAEAITRRLCVCLYDSNEQCC